MSGPRPEVERKFGSDVIDLAQAAGMSPEQMLVAFGRMARHVAQLQVEDGRTHGDAMHQVLSQLMIGLGFHMEKIDGDEGPVH
jgi:rRNA pseudouridine-1189 N-methylase Emg1 (Nep1/Mra1 family)